MQIYQYQVQNLQVMLLNLLLLNHRLFFLNVTCSLQNLKALIQIESETENESEESESETLSKDINLVNILYSLMII